MKSLLLFGQLVLVLLIFGISTNGTNGSKILVLLPIASKSHKLVFDPLIKALALKGNELTVISPVASPNLPISVKEIHPATVEELGYALTGEENDLLETRRELKLTNHFIPILWNTSLVDNGCHRLYNDPEVKYLMKGLKRFDLAIVSGLQNECALGLVYHFKVPHIYLTHTAAPNYVISRFGHYFPTSVVPSPYTTFDDRMSFPERTVNFIVETLLLLVAKVYLYPHYEDIYRSYVGPQAPGIDEIDDNVGVILMNSNYVMSYPRPVIPNIIEIGGLHCHSPRALPTELDKFLSEAEQGFIYFSLGPLIQAVDLPEEILRIFLNVFKNLNQRIVWKWDKEIPMLPKNVLLGHFLPEQNILGHPNIRLFISTGGLLSTQSAICHGVPILGVPLTGEHDLNMEQAENAGYALSWEILEKNQTQLEELINKMIDEPQYKARAKHLSKVYRDAPSNALDRALFWTDYVIKNKGAPHLRSSSKDLNYFQYNQIDVILFLLFVILIVFSGVYNLISCICFTKSSSPSRSSVVGNGSYDGSQTSLLKNKCD